MKVIGFVLVILALIVLLVVIKEPIPVGREWQDSPR